MDGKTSCGGGKLAEFLCWPQNNVLAWAAIFATLIARVTSFNLYAVIKSKTAWDYHGPTVTSRFRLVSRSNGSNSTCSEDEKKGNYGPRVLKRSLLLELRDEECELIPVYPSVAFAEAEPT